MMHVLTMVLCAGALVAPMVGDEPLTLVQKHKLGDEDKVKLVIDLESSLGPVNVQMLVTNKVRKVLEGGAAEVTSQLSQIGLKAMGQDVKQPDPPVRVLKMDSYGRITSDSSAGAKRSDLSIKWVRYALWLPKAAMSVGEVLKIDEIDPLSGSRVTGEVKLVASDHGTAKLSGRVSIAWKQGDPTKLEYVTEVGISNGRVLKSEGRATSLPPDPEAKFTVESGRFTLKRQS